VCFSVVLVFVCCMWGSLREAVAASANEQLVDLPDFDYALGSLSWSLGGRWVGKGRGGGVNPTSTTAVSVEVIKPLTEQRYTAYSWKCGIAVCWVSLIHVAFLNE